ncbi:MAG: twin-arginine translocase subunit TatC [Anaerolineae bacterium]|nr:twin-arginine translocase subunit TatC [Anaerolineae bacterium]MDW8068243.1 twin-arginine translocase subunit TatC [Anaerolineae bacterium]
MKRPSDEPRPFLAHVEELRRRLLWALAALAVGVVISALFTHQVLTWIARPVGGLENLEAIEVTENLGVFMRVALLGGAILAMPFIVYQVWQFVTPGLSPLERRYVYILAPVATLLFLAGAAFAYFVMLPAAIPALLSVAPIPTRPRPADYVSFVTNLMFWVGVSFEMPLLVFFLAKVRLVSPRALLRNWRLAVFLIALLAALVTPTGDPINMALVMIPLVLLYGLSILLAYLAYRKPGDQPEPAL